VLRWGWKRKCVEGPVYLIRQFVSISVTSSHETSIASSLMHLAVSDFAAFVEIATSASML
jgi:hypothetical protein